MNAPVVTTPAVLAMRWGVKRFGGVQALRVKRAKEFSRRAPRALLSLPHECAAPTSVLAGRKS
jgi:hypothetical protein